MANNVNQESIKRCYSWIVYFYTHLLPKTELEGLISDTKLMAMACESAIKNKELEASVLMVATGAYDTVKAAINNYFNKKDEVSLSNEDRDVYVNIEKFAQVISDFATLVLAKEPVAESEKPKKTEAGAVNKALNIDTNAPINYKGYKDKYCDLINELANAETEVYEPDEFYYPSKALQNIYSDLVDADDKSLAEIIKQNAPEIKKQALIYLKYASGFERFDKNIVFRIKLFTQLAVTSMAFEYGASEIYGEKQAGLWICERIIMQALIQCLSTDFEKYKTYITDPQKIFDAILESIKIRPYKNKNGQYLSAKEANQMVQMSDVDALKLYSKAMQKTAAQILDDYETFK